MSVHVEAVPPRNRTRGRRLIRGGICTAVAAAFAGAALFLATHRFRAPDGEPLLLVFGLAEPWLAFFLWLISGPAAVVALALLAPPLIRTIRRIWVRRLLGWLVALIATAAAAAWLLYLVIFFFTGAVRDYLVVTAPEGQKVIVSQDSFDGDTVSIMVQQDAFFYRSISAGQELSGSEAVMRGDCRLENAGDHLLLTCGPVTIPIERSGP